MDNRIITFDELYRSCTLKALNRGKTARGAAQLLGVSMRTVRRWKKNYDIRQCPVTREYFVESLKGRS